MNDFYQLGSGNDCKETSIGLPDGGDTHVHSNPDGTSTVTTFLPGNQFGLENEGLKQHHTFDQAGNLIRTDSDF